MSFPLFMNTQVVNEEGMLTDDWRNVFSLLFQQLGITLSDEGFKLPGQTADNILILNNINSKNKILIDETNDLLKVNLGGVYKTVATL